MFLHFGRTGGIAGKADATVLDRFRAIQPSGADYCLKRETPEMSAGSSKKRRF
jgi:hypothetical protein